MSKSDSDSSSFSKTWELNVYELNRIPHEIMYDDTEIAVSPKILQNELMCPICLDILKHTMTTKECLHRFCHDCIITALRAGNKECPTCRKKLVSKRSLRPDPNFDGIIAKIYPNRDEYDALHEKVLEKLNKKHLTALIGANNSNSKSNRRNANSKTNPSIPTTSNTNQTENSNVNNINNNNSTNTNSKTNKNEHNSTESTSSSASSTSSDSTNQKSTQSNNNKTNNTNENNIPTNGTNQNKSNEALNTNNPRGVKRTANNTNNSDDSDMESRTSTEQSSLHLQGDLDEIEIVLKPHPTKETNLTSKRFLKTTSNATVNHLSKYLWTRLCVEATSTNSTLETASSQNINENSANDKFQLFISSNEKLPNLFQQLDQNLTLDQVIDKYWKLNRPVELFYYQVNKSNNGTTLNDQNGNSNSNSTSSSSSTNQNN